MRKYYFSFLYSLSTSISFILISKIGSTLPPLLALLISTLFATLFFHCINLKKIFYMYRKTFRDPKDWLIVSVWTALIWVAAFYAAHALGAFVFIFLYFTTSAITSYIALFFSGKKLSYYQIGSGLGLTLLLLIFFFLENELHSNIYYFYGSFLGVLGGIASYFYRKSSFYLAQKCELSASQILATRSYGILLFTVLSIPPASYSLLNPTAIFYCILVSIGSLIIPLYANQRGIIQAGPEMHSIIAASCPFVTYLLQFLVDKTWSPVFLATSIICSGLLIMGVIRPHKVQ